MRETVFEGADLLDSRDVIKKISDLQSDEDSLDEEEKEELKRLLALAEEGEDSSDWDFGEILISDDYFETYTRDLAEDIGAISKDASWPITCIDWKEAACQLQQDYFSITYGETLYWIRA